jgi:Fic family protein
MDPERFRHSPAGRPVKIGAEKYAYWAYIPDPLPPSLSLSLPLLQALSRADRALGELAGLGRTIANPHLLIRPFVHQEAVLSSRIEGTRADITDIYAFEAGQLPLPGLASASTANDVQEVLNYVQALEYGLKRLQTLPVSLRLFRELHQRLMSGVRGDKLTPGEFRRSQNWIGPPGSTLNNATFVPPPVDDMMQALYDLEQFINDDDAYPPLIKLAFIHYQFEAIHPFLDGNGRIGRLLIVLLMAHWRLLPHPLLYLSAFFHRHREQYYDLLMAVSERGAWDAWLTFFLLGVAEQAQDASTCVRQLQDLKSAWQERLKKVSKSASPLRLAEEIFAHPILTIPQAQRLLGVSYVTARGSVYKLVDAEILHQIGESSYGKTFVAPEILEILTSESS